MMRKLLLETAFWLLDMRRTRGAHLLRDLRYWSRDIPMDAPVFDIGANIGVFACDFRRFLDRRVFAFEPVGATYSKLIAAVSNDPEITALNMALGAETGVADIAINPDTDLVSSLRPNRKWHNRGITEKVKVTTVDDFVAARAIKRIAVMKIDVEGFECEVLRGAGSVLSRGICDFIVMESTFVSVEDEHHVPLERLIALLLPYGYEPWGVYDCEQRKHDRGGVHLMNVVFGAKG
jgi:FkbM family methyltransferase